MISIDFDKRMDRMFHRTIGFIKTGRAKLRLIVEILQPEFWEEISIYGRIPQPDLSGALFMKRSGIKKRERKAEKLPK